MNPHPSKSLGTAYVLWFFLGGFGAHHFYLRHYGWGVAYLCTLGFLGIGVLVDLFTLPGQVRRANTVAPAAYVQVNNYPQGGVR